MPRSVAGYQSMRVASVVSQCMAELALGGTVSINIAEIRYNIYSALVFRIIRRSMLPLLYRRPLKPSRVAVRLVSAENSAR